MIAKVSEVSVRVPIEDAVAWDPWLTTELGVQAEKMDLGYDGGEEEGQFEVFDFTGDPAQVERAVVLALAGRGVDRSVTRKGTRVTVGGVAGRWLVPLAPRSTVYEKALHRVAEELCSDQDLSAWWASTGLRTLTFHESNQPGRPTIVHGEQEDGELYLMHFSDLTILNEEPKPTKAEGEEVARKHLREVLEAAAEHLGKPLPPG